MVGLSDKTLYSFSFNGRYLQAEMRAQSTLWGLAAGNPRISRLSFDFENGVGTASYLIDAPYSQRDEETPSWSAQFKCNSPEDVSKFLSQLDISSK